MSRVERSLADKLVSFPWLILFIWYGWSSLKAENGSIDFNPVSNIPFGIALVLVGLATVQILWLFNNPFALVKKGVLIVCPAIFRKKTIRIADIVKVRESLTHEQQKIFGFNADYNIRVLKFLMFDSSNGMEITLPLSGQSTKRDKELIKLLAKNNIVVEGHA